MDLTKIGIDTQRDKQVAAIGMSVLAATAACGAISALDATGLAALAYFVGVVVSRKKGDEAKLSRALKGLALAGVGTAALAALPAPFGAVAAVGCGVCAYKLR